MKITQLSYDRLFNLGNYENEKIGAVCTIEEGESLNTAYTKLKETVHAEYERKLNVKEYMTNKNILKNPNSYMHSQILTAQAFVDKYEKENQ